MTSTASPEALYDGLAADTPLGSLPRERFVSLYSELGGAAKGALQLVPSGHRLRGCNDPALAAIFACCSICSAASLDLDQRRTRRWIYAAVKQHAQKFDTQATATLQSVSKHLRRESVQAVVDIVNGERARQALNELVTWADRRRREAMRPGEVISPRHAGRPRKRYRQPVRLMGALLVACGLSKKRAAEQILNFIRLFQLADKGDRVSVSSIQVILSRGSKELI